MILLESDEFFFHTLLLTVILYSLVNNFQVDSKIKGQAVMNERNNHNNLEDGWIE